MVSNTSRAYRRHHRARKIRHALKYYIINFWDVPFNDPIIVERAARLYNHLAVCSCYMCGNQRHNDWQSNKERLTMQERKNEERFKYEMKEVETPEEV